MNRWPGKYVIGLTGNIGTGKSVVRRMLEHLGAFGIDADAISHRVIEKDAPGYAKVVEAFGSYVLGPQGEIDRARLGGIVFSDPEALKMLEGIIHPLVSRATDLIIARSSQQVIVIEAIKLLEGSLGKDCSSIWVTYAPPEVQLERLVNKRKMLESEARKRIEAQSPQEEKIRLADVVIRNVSSFEDTWEQVSLEWRRSIPREYQYAAEKPDKLTEKSPDDLSIAAGKPSNAGEIAAYFREKTSQDGGLTSEREVIKAFGDRAFLLLRKNEALVGIAGWQVENLVARILQLHVMEGVSLEKALPVMIEHIERQSISLQCEVALVFVKPELAALPEVWNRLGYQPTSIPDLRVPVWMEAAQESMPENSILLFKQIRKDRILRPI